MNGSLYIVPTPIGNLKDITLRALETLKRVELIAAENPETTSKLLNEYKIDTQLTKLHQHSASDRYDRILEQLEIHDIALVSEAGTPGISDPGIRLISRAAASGARIVPLPGPSAVTTALSVSGLPADSFIFLGFLPKRTGRRRSILSEVNLLPYTLVLFESPHRLDETLKDLNETLGNRVIVICRELTKVYEEIIRGTLHEVRKQREEITKRGEFVILVEGNAGETAWTDENVRHALSERISAGQTGKEAVKAVAKLSGIPGKRVYAIWLSL